jgi:hypothetical protein
MAKFQYQRGFPCAPGCDIPDAYHRNWQFLRLRFFKIFVKLLQKKIGEGKREEEKA